MRLAREGIAPAQQQHAEVVLGPGERDPVVQRLVDRQGLLREAARLVELAHLLVREAEPAE